MHLDVSRVGARRVQQLVIRTALRQEVVLQESLAERAATLRTRVQLDLTRALEIKHLMQGLFTFDLLLFQIRRKLKLLQHVLIAVAAFEVVCQRLQQMIHLIVEVLVAKYVEAAVLRAIESDVEAIQEAARSVVP